MYIYMLFLITSCKVSSVESINQLLKFIKLFTSKTWATICKSVSFHKNQTVSRLSDSLPIKHLMKHLNVFNTYLQNGTIPR